ncbi:hypothetical protein FDP41_012831 [Naegleria fowleri]|uniref:Ubiquinone biosynthesis monooxygenase COQ7 n=1 Tax=Naegleria fowleri TaxID=5763 RepID=A0A6A5BSK6_NAEFO|nr:uncharacterized protein FDP41_012831 [Naegleria fowleri]KAF0981043.1 hypothetical protein FDP41_012831 [Naegleria fowleri]CAG4709850.1 unnamed protein product [Naegleria fowleri]
MLTQATKLASKARIIIHHSPSNVGVHVSSASFILNNHLICKKKNYSTTTNHLQQQSSDPSSTPKIDKSGLIWRDVNELEDEFAVKSMIRVDHAGELGAVTICNAQKVVLGEDPIVNEILGQEVDHFATFDRMIIERRVRPTIFRSIWQPAGVMLGIGTALLGRNTAMACHEAIENTIFDHYNEQLRDIYEMSVNKSQEQGMPEEKTSTSQTNASDSDIETDTEYFFKSEHQKQEIQEKELREIIKQYRDEELHHHDIARDANTDRNSLLYKAAYGFISTGCSLVIALTKRL